MLLVVLVIKFFRLKLLQMLIEKVMAKSLINATSKLDVDAQISNQLSKVKKFASMTDAAKKDKNSSGKSADAERSSNDEA